MYIHRFLLTPGIVKRSVKSTVSVGWSPFVRTLASKNNVACDNLGPSPSGNVGGAQFTLPVSDPSSQKEEEKESFLDRTGWGPKGLVVGEDFNRWKVIPAATLNHLCLGSVYAWSIFNQPMMRLSGVVAPASNDWALGDVSITFSLIMGGFVWASVFSKKMDQFGPRVSCLIGATSLGLGFSLAGLAVASENLPLLYVGGAIWGIANGWAYVPPVATLVNWFPDRKGFASGITVLGYGGGAIIAAPLFSKLIEHFRVIPEYLGSASDLELMNKDGTLFVDTATGFQEVVVATATDLKTVGLAAICEPGAYLVGTGSTGVAEAFGLLGLGYGTIMAACAFAFRLPPKGYMPSGGHDSSVSTEEKVATKVPDTPINAATFSPQFWLLYAGFGLSITGTYGLLSSGTVILNEAFGQNLPLMVTAGFTSAFVAGMSAANLTGRIVIPSISDTVGKVIGGDPFYARKYTYTALWSTAPFLYGGIIWSIHECASNPSVVPLAVFTGSTLGILSIFGGSTANRPAMIADIFGLKNMGVITARQLSVVMPASFLGPQTVAYFRKADTEKAIIDLSSKVDDNVFEQAFGAGKESLSCLIDSNTVTISRLLELAPHLQDPTPYLFDTSMYLMAGCQLAALSTNLALRPVCPPNSKVPK